MTQEEREAHAHRLENEVRKAGFPGTAVAQTGEKIREGKEEAFYIPFEASIEKKPVKGSLYFEESLLHDGILWHSFELDLGKDSNTLFRTNNFLVGFGYDTSLREAVNLMQDRYVYKEPSFDREGRGYWAYLDIHQYTSGYSRLVYYLSDFRVEKALSEPIPGHLLTPQQKMELAEALRQGDRHPLDLVSLGIHHKVWAEASPATGMIKLTDVHGKQVHLRSPSVGAHSEVLNQRYPKRRAR